jgi:hypothetical protein
MLKGQGLLVLFDLSGVDELGLRFYARWTWSVVSYQALILIFWLCPCQ